MFFDAMKADSKLTRQSGAAAGVIDGFEHAAMPRVVTSAPFLLRKAEAANTSRLKRLVDVSGALLGLMFLWPLFIVVAIAIRMDSAGPAVFRQSRYGANRKPFMIYKFRTMTVMESNGAFVQARADDARVTRVGKFLRQTSIDELPQLLNVLRGDMSLVGPRPHAIAMDDTFGKTVPGYLDRHLVRPGLTGLAQVEGHRGPTASNEAIEARLAHDRVYIRNWSIWLDIRIILMTPIRLLSHKAF